MIEVVGWPAGCGAYGLFWAEIITTSLLHLTSLNLQDSQLSRESKMEPSVAILQFHGSILQAETSHIPSLAENQRWSRV